MDLIGWPDEAEFTSPSGLPPGELVDVLRASTAERGGGAAAAVELLHRSGGWLEVLDAEGLIAIGPPRPRTPDNPEPRPRSVIRWAAAAAALEHGGVLADRGHVRHHDPRLLRIAASLAGGVPVALADVLGNLHGETARLVVAAVSASTQGHWLEYDRRLPDGRDSGWTDHLDVGTPYPWPEPEPADQQPELELFPARVAEERALAWALANPAPPVELPLRPEVRAVLDHLHFASGMRGHGLGRVLRRTEPLLDGRTVVPDGEFTAWAGVEAPEIVTAWAHRRVLARRPDDDQVTVFWIPADADVAEFTWERAEAIGAPTLTVDLHDGEPDPHPELPATRFHRAPGGWTSVTVGRGVVSVQRIDPDATRIAWGRLDLPRPLACVLNVPLLPTPAVELALRSPGLPFAR